MASAVELDSVSVSFRCLDSAVEIVRPRCTVDGNAFAMASPWRTFRLYITEECRGTEADLR